MKVSLSQVLKSKNSRKEKHLSYPNIKIEPSSALAYPNWARTIISSPLAVKKLRTDLVAGIDYASSYHV